MASRAQEQTEFQQFLNQIIGSAGARLSLVGARPNARDLTLLITGAHVVDARTAPDPADGWIYDVMFGTHSSEPGQAFAAVVRDPVEERAPGVFWIPQLGPDGRPSDPEAWIVLRTKLTQHEYELLAEGNV